MVNGGGGLYTVMYQGVISPNISLPPPVDRRPFEKFIKHFKPRSSLIQKNMDGRL